jgi:hypothetical protein
MKRPLAELVQVRPSPAAWQAAPTCHAAHDRTATPHRRTVAGQPAGLERDRLEHDQLTALIASRYNTHRPRELAAILQQRSPNPMTKDEAEKLITAAEELRNRLLTQHTPTGQRTPPRRYYLPEQLAAHHIDPRNARTAALDFAAIAHHPDDRAAYLKHLRAHDHEQTAGLAEGNFDALEIEITALLTELRKNPRARRIANEYDSTAGRWKIRRLTLAENTALDIAQRLAYFEERLSHYRKADRENNKRKTRAEERQQLEAEYHNTRPPEADELDGWLPVHISKPPREIAHLGRLGRKRSTSDTGKTPNRIANYCGDPLRRIYTRKTRGTNALVIVDCSGSMSLTADDLDAILKASTGATVVAYSAGRDDDRTPNTYLLAHNQRRVRHLPDFAGGNGVDAPAAAWAIKNYRKAGAPVLWITDGRATGQSGYSTYKLRKQCQKLAQKHAITVARNVEEALADLATLAAGHRPPRRLDTFE